MPCRVYRAVNFKTAAVAACKVVSITPDTPKKARQTLDKEIAVHVNLKHAHVLEFIDSMIVEPDPASTPTSSLKEASKKRKRGDANNEDRDEEKKEEEEQVVQERYHPGYYMLLEIAGGGDLFDKIGAHNHLLAAVRATDLVLSILYSCDADALAFTNALLLCTTCLRPQTQCTPPPPPPPRSRPAPTIGGLPPLPTTAPTYTYTFLAHAHPLCRFAMAPLWCRHFATRPPKPSPLGHSTPRHSPLHIPTHPNPAHYIRL